MGDYEYDHWMFITLDSLPTVGECVQAITTYAPSFGGTKQKEHVHHFCKHVLEVWKKAFGRDVECQASSTNVDVPNVKFITIDAVKKRMTKHLKYYATKVQKAKGSKRVNMKNWYDETNQLLDLFTDTVDPEKFDETERNFYYDQLSRARRMKIDVKNIDNEYEDKLAKIEMNRKLEEEMAEELDNNNNIMESTFVDQTGDSENINFSINRSGIIRQTTSINEHDTQTPSQYNLRDGSRYFCESIKVALAALSAAANISPHQARVAFQVTSEKCFGQKYVLSPENASMVEPDEPKCKKPRTKEQYSAEYQDVLPSTKTITRMKHLMAIQQERNVALALLDAAAADVITVHYDTTTRKRLNGEWPSLIVKTSSGKTFRLRSLNMAVEDRNNIVNLFLASLSRLALTVHADKNVLWEKITALMTDSVAKNLQIENLIAASLSSQHIPLHVLCVSHTCEAFDTGNLIVLKHVEQKSDMKNMILKRMPSLRSFLSKGVLPAVITALCKVVSNDGHKSSKYEEFDNVLENAEKSKKLSIFKERRFGLLGYSAAALIHSIDDLKTTMETTASHNQLVQVCELYLEVDYIEVALRCIAWFTFKITLPFLNMCELETTKTLLSILPTLHDDLSVCNMDTLERYKVDYSFTVEKPVSPLATYILERFCRQAAIDLARQRGREYGFVEVDDDNLRATDLTKVHDEVVENLPGP